MATNFKRDLAKARKAEHLVYEVLNSATIDYSFAEVGDQEEYFYKGDIMAIDFNNNVCFIDVKDDSRIAETNNVLCEAKVYSYKQNEYLKGNMQSDYDYIAVVAQQINTIYIIDFSVLKKNYKQGKHYVKDHYDDNGELAQKTIGTLCSLNQIKHWGGLLYTIKYKEDNGSYCIV